MDILIFIFGMFFGCILLEPIVINFIYFTNVALFCDLILSPKNKNKLSKYFSNEKLSEKK